jgi:hypothetical protein
MEFFVIVVIDITIAGLNLAWLRSENGKGIRTTSFCDAEYLLDITLEFF